MKGKSKENKTKQQFAGIAFNYGIICFAINQDIDLENEHLVCKLKGSRLKACKKYAV